MGEERRPGQARPEDRRRSAPPAVRPDRTCTSRCWCRASRRTRRSSSPPAGRDLAGVRHRLAAAGAVAPASPPAGGYCYWPPVSRTHPDNRDRAALLAPTAGRAATAFMATNLLTQIFGSRNDRLLKQYRADGASRSTRWSRSSSSSTTTQLRAKTDEFRAARRPRARRSTTCCPRPSPSCARPASASLKMRHFDVQLIGGMALHDGKIAEMRTGEGKTLVATLPVVPERARRQGRARGHRQRLPRRRDAEWMGRLYNFLGLTVGVNLPQHAARGEAGRLRRRHHLRHQQRVRLRLPARQHGLRGRRPRAARPELRDRRRGRLDPDRRGAHAADHQRPGRGPHRAVRAHQRGRAAAEEADRRGRPAHRRGRDRAGRLHGRREGAPGLPDRSTATRTPRRSCPRRACWPRARACTTRPTSR